MSYSNIRGYIAILAMVFLMWGCGGGGTTQSDKVASITVMPSSSGVYIIQGNNMNGVAGIELTVTYDNSILAVPTVTQGEFVTGAMMVSNTSIPGTIRIALISTKVFSGSGQIATISFAGISASGSPDITISAVKLLNVKGEPVP